jgi:hypothetical protein
VSARRVMKRFLYLLFAALAVFLVVSASVVGLGALVNAVFAPLIVFALRILTYS